MTAQTRTDRAIPRGLVPVMCLMVTTTAVMTTSVVPLLPVIGAQLGAGPAGVAWVLTANLLAAAVGTTILSRIADRRDPRRVLLAILLLVVAGSMLCAVWDSLAPLIIGRSLQGLSFAMFPICVAVLRAVLPPERLARAVGLMSGLLAVGGGAGMVVAGVLQTDGADYRRVFWMLLVLVTLALALAWVVIPGVPRPAGPLGLDPLGAIVLAVGLVALLTVLSEGAGWGWGSPLSIGLAVGGVLALAVWIAHSLRARDPLVPPELLISRRVGPIQLGSLFVGAAMYLQFLGGALFVQADPEVAGYGFGASVLWASLVYLLPGMCMGMVAAACSGSLVARHGPTRVFVGACAVGVLGFALLAVFHGQPWQFIVAMMVINIFNSTAAASLPSLLVRKVPEAQTGVANGINAVTRILGSSLASAFLGAMFAGMLIAGTDVVAKSAYLIGFWAGAVLAGLAGVVVLLGRRAH